MRELVIKKLVRNERGLTLVEMMVTLVILVLGSTILATGVPAAIDAYGKLVDSSNSQVLLSTVITRLRDELSMAQNWSVEKDSSDPSGLRLLEIRYWSGVTQGETVVALYKESVNGEPQSNDSNAVTFHENELLIGGEPFAKEAMASGKERADLYITCTAMNLVGNKDVIMFKDLEVHKDGYESALASIETYAIRMFSDGETG